MFRLPARTLVSLSTHARPVCRRHGIPRLSAHIRPILTASPGISRRNQSTTSSGPKRCPSCSTPLPTSLPVCPKCFHITPIPESMTYHEMLGTPYEPNPFVVDVRQLKDQFRAVQAIVHPDRWVGKPPVCARLNARRSALTVFVFLYFRSTKRSRPRCLLASMRLCISYRIR